MKAKIQIFVFLVAFAVIGGISSISHAQLTAVGPVDVGTGFPAWFRDIPGLQLGPCDVINEDPVNNGTNLPPCPTLILNNFGGGFVPGNITDFAYYRAVARFDPLGLVIPDSRLRIDLRGEPGTVINQVEVRLRTVPVVGDYSVVTPFGTFVVPVNNLNETIVILPGAAQGITADNFVGALAGNVEFFFTNGTGNLVNPALGTFWGDGATPAPLLMPPGFVLPPDGALTFRVIGPLGSGVDAAQPNFTV